MLSSSGNSHGALPRGAKNYFERNKEEFPYKTSCSACVHLPDPHHYMGQLLSTLMRSVEANLEGVLNTVVNFAYTCFKGTLSLDSGRVMGMWWRSFHVFLCSE